MVRKIYLKRNKLLAENFINISYQKIHFIGLLLKVEIQLDRSGCYDIAVMRLISKVINKFRWYHESFRPI